jgi:hypothetical protein
MHNAERLCIFCTLLFFNYSYLTEDYSHMAEAIVDWKAGHLFWHTLHFEGIKPICNKAVWHTFFNSVNVSFFYTLEAAAFVGYSVALAAKSEGFYRRAWRWLARFFSVRLFMEIYAVAFGASINEKKFTAVLFSLTLLIIVIVFFLEKYEAMQPPKLTQDEL